MSERPFLADYPPGTIEVTCPHCNTGPIPVKPKASSYKWGFKECPVCHEELPLPPPPTAVVH